MNNTLLIFKFIDTDFLCLLKTSANGQHNTSLDDINFSDELHPF